MARSEGFSLKFKHSGDHYIRRGMAVIDRTIAMNDAVSADAVIAKLEAKMAQTRKVTRP